MSEEPTIVIDTREQRPWEFPAASVVRATLKAGDYSLVGAEDRCAIERKTLDDFVSSVTFGRERFLRELEKLRCYDFAAVIVEANFADAACGWYASTATASSIVGSAVAITVDYVPVIWAGNRALSQAMAVRLLTRFWKKRVATKETETVAA